MNFMVGFLFVFISLRGSFTLAGVAFARQDAFQLPPALSNGIFMNCMIIAIVL
jgi:hypothetical protein